MAGIVSYYALVYPGFDCAHLEGFVHQPLSGAGSLLENHSHILRPDFNAERLCGGRQKGLGRVPARGRVAAVALRHALPSGRRHDSTR